MAVAAGADGVQLAWTAEGRGEPLLLIAGQATGADGWNPVVQELARTFRVIRFDHRGVGRSAEGDPGAYSTRLFAADAAAVLDAAGADRAHVYGHSMGGRVAQWVAIDHPHRVGALVLAATAAGGPAGHQRSREATDALYSGDPARMEPYFFDPAWARHHPDDVRAFFTSRASTAAKRGHFRASRDHDAREGLAAIAARTLVLHGTEDALTPSGHAKDLFHAIPRATLVKVPGGRHGFHLDRAETTRWVGDFIGRVR
ncbi:alpha/beta fold hydrolase [Arthrobacter agilis]|uniref:alpha/beta fold hydrolase n=1 Tax=Arthrobacter agilis TaxID=37921 RepID=UPI00278262A0|nr:alpha/beta fold hydrolase [Arthrobacter agilis]MDQ0736487.1 pimeloyl-ACP methyl ester carboxylesterase [Arthrobacter agilis]